MIKSHHGQDQKAAIADKVLQAPLVLALLPADPAVTCAQAPRRAANLEPFEHAPQRRDGLAQQRAEGDPMA